MDEAMEMLYWSAERQKGVPVEFRHDWCPPGTIIPNFLSGRRYRTCFCSLPILLEMVMNTWQR